MLFSSPNSISLPSHLVQLLAEAQSLLKDRTPPEVYDLVFRQPLARQVILNLYQPGQGITPHVDLPNRYADGILGVSLIGGTSMVFSHDRGERHEVYLPPRSVYVLTGEARWVWSHGIEERTMDIVEGKDGEQTVMRDLRVSVTYRWLQQGGEVLS
jgi:alkylated DNA repair dioxygenase AlkB